MQADLNRLCHAEIAYMKENNNKWNLFGFQAWLDEKWGVKWIGPSLPANNKYIEILDKNKYLLFLLAYSHDFDE
jgi:hypothetical protein